MADEKKIFLLVILLLIGVHLIHVFSYIYIEDRGNVIKNSNEGNSYAHKWLEPSNHQQSITEGKGDNDNFDRFFREKKKMINNPKLHFVFSTSCNYFQDWQARVLLWSAKYLVHQPGKFSRIISGCDGFDEDNSRRGVAVSTHPGGLSNELVSKESIKIHLDSFPRAADGSIEVFAHFTPTFEGSQQFPWINKPLGLNHWRENTQFDDDEIVIILDPDMIFISQFDFDANQKRDPNSILCSFGCKNRHLKHQNEEKVRWWEGFISPENIQNLPREGHPVAQSYGLGSDWLNKFNFTALLMNPNGHFKVPIEQLKDHPLMKLEAHEARRHYAVGPPYMLTANDFQKLMPRWQEYMYPSYEAAPGDILADMYAYSLASVEQNLPHLSLDHFMISNLKAGFEAWDWIDPLLHLEINDIPEKILSEDFALPTCSNALTSMLEFGDSHRLPNLLHLAQYYSAKRTPDERDPEIEKFKFYLKHQFFHKGHVPANIFKCELPLLKLPPEDFIQKQTLKVNRRGAWMVCITTELVNEAVSSWKKDPRNCNNSTPAANYQKKFRMMGPRSCTQETRGISCWEGATIDDF